MNYELAKHLKEAGFPNDEREVIFHPTLSELIEGCNPVKADEFGLMTDTIHNWTAFYSYNGYFEHNEKFLQSDDLYEVSLNVYGDTPEEAVASLWLKLNEK